MSKLNLFRSANKVTMLLIVFGSGGGVSVMVMMLQVMGIVCGGHGSVIVVMVQCFISESCDNVLQT